MTTRSRLYFKMKWANKMIKSESGRAWLASKGIHPIDFKVSGTIIPEQVIGGYMVDQKGRILGSTLWPKPVTKKVNVALQQAPTTWKVKIELASPDALKEATL